MKKHQEPELETPFTEGNKGNEGGRIPGGRAPACGYRSRSSARHSLSSLRSLLFISVLAAVALPALAGAQAIEAWVQRYDGPANGNDSAAALAVDAVGNVFVTGYSEGTWQCVTLAYSSAGVPLWTNLYPESGSGATYGYALAVDSSGNVYVTGDSNDASYNPHCFTIKFSSTGVGVPLWTNVYSTSGTYGRAVALDPSGNVFVAAISDNGSQSVTIKYSSAGAQLWARNYNSGTSIYPMAMAVDASGNVFITSNTTLKYSSTGTLLWSKTLPGGTASSLAVDSEGNVVVTGRVSANGAPTDYATIKYSGAGVALWTNLYNGPGNTSDEALRVAVDTRGDVIVTGWSFGAGTGADYATIKYSSDGRPLWTNRYNGPVSGSDRPTAMAMDASGNVVVTGWSQNAGGTYWDYATVAYSSAGKPLWSKRYNGPGNKRDEPRGVVVDTRGNVYVTGFSEALGSGEPPDPQNTDYATVKYVIPPITTRQPLSCTNSVGTTASFSVEVAGSAPFTYQWQRDGTNLADGGKFSGVTTTNLLIANVQLADAAGYSVVITNAYGSVTSSVAQLTVTVPPNPGRFSNLSYSPETGFSFIFRDGTLGRQYRIQTSSSLAEGSWVDWQTFTYNGPVGFMDVGATGTERRFYRAVSP